MNPFDFASPWRRIYEIRMAVVWMAAAAATYAITRALPAPPLMGQAAAAVCMAMAAWRAIEALLLAHRQDRINRRYGPRVVSLEDVARAVRDGEVWLGEGYDWTDAHAQQMHALTSQNAAGILDRQTDGAHWLHGLDREGRLYAPVGLLDGHTLVVGSTGVGKTRLFDLLIAQAILRDEPVIIIDPKGDHGLAANARKVCEAIGQPDRFVYFHPAHPEVSACIDPLRNWNRSTELASRIAALIPSETGADPFTAFGWKVLNDIVNGLIATGQRPNLVHLRRYVEGSPDELVLRALRAHFARHVEGWEGRAAAFVKQYKGNALLGYIAYYREVVAHEAHSVELDGLISTFEHNREHFQKMVASLIPILSMLTTGRIRDLLSPDLEPGHDRVVTDMAAVIRADKVLYVGLDSLADATVGSAIGSILLADLTAVAGDRYNYGIESIKPINVFVDEAAEVINQPTIQLLNKGRGAGFRMTVATQTFADFAARLGDENKARQVLANTNNKIALRVQDAETQQYFADGIPKIKARSMSVRYGQHLIPSVQDEYTASYQEQAVEEEADLIPPALLSELPPLHYFARLSGGRTVKGRLPILVA
ncbi:MAG: conjugative transfer system coupling protein TraD [Thiobacillaceae bacterium]|nr:conjugative transfer system coupling protein TraD [Thiobacillaceae bacterium]